MEVILLQNVESLGKQGDLVKVKDGYARNFLIPQKLAAASTPESLKMLEQMRKKRAKEDAKMKAEAEEIAKKIGALSCTIAVEAGVEDKIFGSVTQEMVKNALRQEGIEVDKKDIIMEEPIKKLGVYPINIKLMHDVTGTLRIWVVKK
jgi:large subunit ribosomal protein L9